MTDSISIAIRDETDIVEARSRGRALAGQMGMHATDATLLTTAISEIARNALQHAGGGEVRIQRIEENGRVGIEVEARDRGRGIEDVERAFQDGYSSAGGLGLGLPGARRLMDTMDLRTGPGQGTVIIMKKWVSP